MSRRLVRIKVSRFDPTCDEGPRWETFTVPHIEGMRVLDALNYIHDQHDGSLSYRWVCRTAQCGSCAVLVDGRPRLACETEIAADALEVTLEPLRAFPVVKDLVVDTDRACARLEAIRPYLSRDTSGGRSEDMTSEQAAELRSLRSCIECWSCVSSCPVANEAAEGFLGPMGLCKLAELDADQRDVLDRVGMALSQGVYECTTCLNCWSVCPQQIRVPEKAVEKLRAMAVRKGLGPLPAHKVAVSSIRNYWNPWMAPRAQRARWARPFDMPSRGGTMFFAGCSPSLLRPEQASSVARIFAAMGEPIGYLGKAERCCASPLLRIGETDLFLEMARANLEAMRKAGADRLVVTCAGCYKAWKEDYPEHLGPLGIEVLHVSEVLEQALQDGKLSLRQVPENERTVAYHDPCHLGRAGGIYGPPRNVLLSVPGIKLVEMALGRENSACCGSGGGVRTARPALSLSIGRKRVGMAEEAGAAEVISCCPWCEQNMEEGVKASGNSGPRVRDLVEVVAAALMENGKG